MEHDSLAFASAVELARLIRSRQLSPVELVELFLRRIEDLNPRLKAYLTVTGEEAREAARQAEEALQRGGQLLPLLGIPISIKDLFFTRGIRTTGGSLAYASFIPEEDALPVERLRRAGAIILGKTNTSEFGMSATTENYLAEDCCNPWDTGRTSGGSSGGAAVSIAAGLAPLAIGSDGGGSIRIPASFCGVFGFKPTYGLVPSSVGFGGMPLFSHPGPLTRTVGDAALMLNVIAGPDPRDPNCLRDQRPDFVQALRSKGRAGRLKAAWSPNLGYAVVDSEVISVAEAAARSLDSLGCDVEEATPAIGEPFSTFRTIALADGYAAHAHLLEDQADILVSYVKSTLERGKQVTGADYSRALRDLERFRRQMVDFFDKYDLLLTPTTAVSAFPLRQRPREIDGKRVDPLWSPFPLTVPFNLTGQPAATVPCGFSPDGLPIGLQIIGRWKEDVIVLRASAAFEQAHPWAGKRPPVS